MPADCSVFCSPLPVLDDVPAPVQGAAGRDGIAPAVSPRHAELVETLLGWFQANKRPLPWRERYDPYEVWISEVMLQQTQMTRAAEYFRRWTGLFPTLRSLAEADPDAVLKAWEGLGYYSRARNAQRAARAIMERHGGRLPDDERALRALPGIGEYTAGAVLSIAFNKPYVAVDANVERVFARLFDVGAPVKSAVSAGFIRHMAASLLPEGRARDFNQALMEFGALVCGKKPLCETCPLAGFCQARRLGIVAERPVPGRKTGYTALEIVCGVIIDNGRLFLQKRLDSGVWAGFWEFPGGRVEPGEDPCRAVVREIAEETEFSVKVLQPLGLVRHSYTRYKIAMHCFACALEELPEGQGPDGGLSGSERPRPVLHAATEYRWVRPEDLSGFVLPAGHRKLADAWFEQLQCLAEESIKES